MLVTIRVMQCSVQVQPCKCNIYLKKKLDKGTAVGKVSNSYTWGAGWIRAGFVRVVGRSIT